MGTTWDNLVFSKNVGTCWNLWKMIFGRGLIIFPRIYCTPEIEARFGR
jgi:hypothetical protein